MVIFDTLILLIFFDLDFEYEGFGSKIQKDPEKFENFSNEEQRGSRKLYEIWTGRQTGAL